MKAKNTIGKIYVSQCLFRTFCKHFVGAFKLQFVYLIGGGARPHLGATRPRVGIANLRLDALSWQYLKY